MKVKMDMKIHLYMYSLHKGWSNRVCLSSLARKSPLWEIQAPERLFIHLICLNRQEKNALLFFEMLDNVHESCISIGHSYQPHPLANAMHRCLNVHARTRTSVAHSNHAVPLASSINYFYPYVHAWTQSTCIERWELGLKPTWPCL